MTNEKLWYVEEMTDEQDGEGFEGMFGVFNINTGFCISNSCDKEDAQDKCDELNGEK